MKKVCGFILVFLGLSLLTHGTVLLTRYDLEVFAISDATWKNPPFEFQTPFTLWLFAFIAGMPGVLFLTVGEYLARPRHLWIVVSIVGIYYCLSLAAGMVYAGIKGGEGLNFRGLIGASIFYLVLALPGLICTIEGTLIFRSGRKGVTPTANRTE